MRDSRSLSALLLLCLAAHLPDAFAEPTPVDIHVLSRDAKFIGSGVGGARITVTDAASGEVLAQGITRGGTGNTGLIMGPRQRDTRIIDDDTAGFTAVLQLDAPTQVRVSAYGPLAYPASAHEVAASRWVVPGDPADRAAWILEMPGLIVDLHDTPTLVRMGGEQAVVHVHATVRMMCGCPVSPDGLWDSNEFDIRAHVMQGQQEIISAPLRYAGEASEFAASLHVPRTGSYRLTVVARQARTGNAGVFEQTLVID